MQYNGTVGQNKVKICKR